MPSCWCNRMLDVATYPAGPHIERPGVHYQGEWLSSFLWIRDHTPKDAVFALDADYLSKSGVDLHGFRAIAERSALADQEKDSGAASVFPELAERWKQQSAAQSDWEHVSRSTAARPSRTIRSQLGAIGKSGAPWGAWSVPTGMAGCAFAASWTNRANS